MILVKHFPAIQVLIILFGALFSALSFNNLLARLFSIIAVSSSLIISLYGLALIKGNSPKGGNGELLYAYGDWQAPYGIEYKIDYLNQPIIIFINAILLFFLIFNDSLVKSTVLRFISDKKQHLFYSILLFAHLGYLGIISTNDLFNLYVFIEISSLSAYVLMAQGNNPKAAIGAFDYLILGSIGATLILIGIGFLFSYTGSLNISDIKNLINGENKSIIVLAGSSFFLMGVILKMAFFPLHFWMIRAYAATAPVILTYLGSISTIVGTYIFIKFAYNVLNYNDIYLSLLVNLQYLALFSIIICGYLAYTTQNLKKIIIYSSCSQVAYAVLLLSLPQTEALLFKFLLIDGINKIALFSLIAHIENNSVLNKKYWRIFVVLTLVCSAGLPINAMFIMKLNIMEILIQRNLWFAFFIIIISSIISFLYHFKIAKKIFFESEENFIISGKSLVNNLGLIFIILIQILMLFSYQHLNFDLKFSQILLSPIINV